MNIKFRVLYFALIILILGGSDCLAQKFEITPFYGFMFNGKVIGYEGDLNIRDDGVYGAILDITIQNGMQIELYYSRSDTRVDFDEFRGPIYKLTDASVNYMQIGFLRTLRNMNNASLYGIGSLGATLFSPSGGGYDETEEKLRYDDLWLFSVTFGGGTKILLSKRIGLRLEGRLLMPITWSGVGFMIGTGGSGFHIGGGSGVLQASLMAGLTFRLGQ